ncbi:hypothetical protein GGTG_02219 [Gaeumannomyces tritici R3-111a-1]|uniref:Uncharacterized protein n=1 Tax=Gaeumannomyces tritici (strain R3-111a-1) TaxID=644352 RepID=J3NLR9_GAET3|nr:hypothetical protein GGTG_02219 [Gaeumannomyces tritici R3-111a-1]EJT82245.1 hypothetical protein GGTG_02219 [Gaeumannomyces tritici R3-111a-1]
MAPAALSWNELWIARTAIRRPRQPLEILPICVSAIRTRTAGRRGLPWLVTLAAIFGGGRSAAPGRRASWAQRELGRGSDLGTRVKGVALDWGGQSWVNRDRWGLRMASIAAGQLPAAGTQLPACHSAPTRPR